MALAPNFSNAAMALETLRNDNYEKWSICVRNYLIANDLWETTNVPPGQVVDFKTWRKKNAAALFAIQIFCGQDMFWKIMKIDSAKIAWDELAKMDQSKSLEASSSGTNKGSDISPSLKGKGIAIPEQSHHVLNIPPNGVSGDRKKNDEPPIEDEYDRFIPLIHAINKGDLDEVNRFIGSDPLAKTATIMANGYNALHIACREGQPKIVKKLVGILSAKDLESRDNDRFTALAVVAQNPALINIAECLLNKNRGLIKIRTNQGLLPVVVAACGHFKDMTRYLYSVTRKEEVALDNKNGSILLICCIMADILDVAYDFIKYNPGFTTTKDHLGMSPIHALSRMASIFPSGSKLPLWKQPIYFCIHVSLSDYSNDIPTHDEESNMRRIKRQVLDYIRKVGSTLLGIPGMKKLYEMKLMHRQAREILRYMSKQISTLQLSDPAKSDLRDYVTDSIFIAIRYGTVEFVKEMVKTNPPLLYIRNWKRNGIFHYAVQYRQEKIFSLLYGIFERKGLLTGNIDQEGRTITHLAGLLAPSSQLARISGAPLQIQRELQWYKEVKSVVGSIHDFVINEDGETPDVAFTKNHKELAKEGEKWMKQTASSCTVVGALIITVSFMATFTVPGGNDQNTGYPTFLHKKLFTVFIITDAISLIFSSTSVLMFLAILISRYAEEDFLKSLPTKLIIGLSTLFLSIASMMIAFCAALILKLKGELHIVVPLVSLACIPIVFFIHLQFPLLLDIFMSTYGPSIFNRKMKTWF